MSARPAARRGRERRALSEPVDDRSTAAGAPRARARGRRRTRPPARTPMRRCVSGPLSSRSFLMCVSASGVIVITRFVGAAVSAVLLSATGVFVVDGLPTKAAAPQRVKRRVAARRMVDAAGPKGDLRLPPSLRQMSARGPPADPRPSPARPRGRAARASRVRTVAAPWPPRGRTAGRRAAWRGACRGHPCGARAASSHWHLDRAPRREHVMHQPHLIAPSFGI